MRRGRDAASDHAYYKIAIEHIRLYQVISIIEKTWFVYHNTFYICCVVLFGHMTPQLFGSNTALTCSILIVRL